MKDLFLILVLVVILGGAVWYVYRSKKKGARCIGCSNSGCCNGSCCGGKQDSTDKDNN